MNREHERGDSQSAPSGNARSLVPSLGRIKYLRMAGGQRAAGIGQWAVGKAAYMKGCEGERGRRGP